jgi:predicted nucleotidyltransferase
MSFVAPEITREAYGEANIRLGKIEAADGVTILFAVESGSRAWGFPSPDSDYDVRFFYIRPISSYLGLSEPRDVIERPIEEPWDLNGWDLRKALRLLINGNATVAEWLSSPLIYREHGPFPYRLRDLIKRHASPNASARHYYGLTRTCYAGEIASRPTAAVVAAATARGETIKGSSEVNYKKYFYAVRGACAISWIRRYSEIPPMTLPALLSHDVIPSDARELVGALQRAKATMGEAGRGVRQGALDSFIEEQLAWAKENGMDRHVVAGSFVVEANQLLLDALGIG